MIESKRCPYCDAQLLWSPDRGAHCDNCDDYDQAEMTTKLNPCPLCKKQPIITEQDELGAVYCPPNRCHYSVSADTLDEAIALHNSLPRACRWTSDGASFTAGCDPDFSGDWDSFDPNPKPTECPSCEREAALAEVLTLLTQEPVIGDSGIRFIELASIGAKIERLKGTS